MEYGVGGQLWVIAGAAVAAAFEIIGHWFPWKALLGEQLPRIPAYIYGLAGVIGGFAVWAFATGNVEALVVLILISVVAGAAVIMAYALDEVAARKSQQRTRTPYERGEEDHPPY